MGDQCSSGDWKLKISGASYTVDTQQLTLKPYLLTPNFLEHEQQICGETNLEKKTLFFNVFLLDFFPPRP